MALTKQDRKTIGEAVREIVSDPDSYDGPVTVMLSSGYADVWPDGEVTQGGSVIAKFGDAGDLEEDFSGRQENPPAFNRKQWLKRWMDDNPQNDEGQTYAEFWEGVPLEDADFLASHGFGPPLVMDELPGDVEDLGYLNILPQDYQAVADALFRYYPNPARGGHEIEGLTERRRANPAPAQASLFDSAPREAPRMSIPRQGNPRKERLLETTGPVDVYEVENSKGRVYYTARYSNGVMHFDTPGEALQWARDNASAIQRFIDLDIQYRKAEAEQAERYRKQSQARRKNPASNRKQGQAELLDWEFDGPYPGLYRGQGEYYSCVRKDRAGRERAACVVTEDELDIESDGCGAWGADGERLGGRDLDDIDWPSWDDAFRPKKGRRGRRSNPDIAPSPSKKFVKHLDEALAHHGLASYRKSILEALKHPNAVAVRLYPNGWVANSYKWRANGVAVEITEAGIFEKKIDRKRPNGKGPTWSVLSAKNGVLASA